MMTARGKQCACHPGKSGEARALLTTEKMLSANQQLSNIFLQRGQNIDIADKKGVFDQMNFGSGEGLAFY